MGIITTYRPSLSIDRIIYRINVLYIFGTLVGSLLYFGSTMLSLQNLMLIPSLIINLSIISKRRYDKALIIPLALLILYLLVVVGTTVALMTEPENASNTFKALVYQLNLLNLFIIPILGGEKIYNTTLKISKYILIFWFIWAAIQTMMIFQIIPFNEIFFFRKEDTIDEESAFQINGVFNNANDFSCMALLITMFIVLNSHRKILKNIFFYCGGAEVIMSMSRTATVLLIMIIPAIQWAKQKFNMILKICIIIISIFFILSLSKDDWEPKVETYLISSFGHNAILINFQRVTSILDFGDDDAPEDHSAKYRTSSYEYAIPRLPLQIDGLGYMNYSDFYGPGHFKDQLVWVNPHSFLIEIGIAFGFPALICFISFLISMGYYCSRTKAPVYYKRMGLVMLIYTILLSNVPSSIILMPMIWIPLFFTYTNIISFSLHTKEVSCKNFD